MPIYVRAGAIIPFDSVRQYTSEKIAEPTILKIYQGEDGQFTLYEDDGISLDYLQGKSTWTKFTWDDKAKKLIIEPDYPLGWQDMALQPIDREFVVELIPEGLTKKIRYQGKRMVITLSN